MEIFFKTEKLTKFFGSLKVLKNIDFTLNKGEIVGLIGPNGAGKSTFLNVIAGILPPTSGVIIFKNKKISNKKTHEICKAGIVKTSQIPQPFKMLTVFENVYLGAVYGGMMVKKDALKQTEEVLEKIGLLDVKDKLGENLNFPERRKLEFARALATKPELLLLDETMAGLTSKEIDEMIEIIKKINKNGITIIVVEHIIEAVMKVANRIVVLNYGEKIADGNPNEVINSSDVQRAYFGVE